MNRESSVEMIAEAQRIFQEQLIDSLKENMGVVTPDNDKYLELACKSLEEVWHEGAKCRNLEVLSDSGYTEFGTWCESFSLEDYVGVPGSSSDKLEGIEWEDADSEENLRRNFVLAAAREPERLLRDEMEELYGFDPINDGDFVLGK